MNVWKSSICAMVAALLMGGSPAWAENEGLADLDKATELKLTATDLEDLSEVVTHLNAALEKGLTAEHLQFAKQLLAATHFERGAALSSGIFGEDGPSPQWPQLRQLALPELEKSLEFNPQQPAAQLLVARLQTLPGGDRNAALAALDAVIETPDAPQDVLADAYTLRGGLQTDDEQRLADFARAIELAPEEAEALRARGLFYLVKEQLPKAIADLRGAAKLEPDHGPTYEALGLALMMDKQYDEAIESLNHALEAAPDSATAYMNRARIHIIEENFDKALADLTKAVELDPAALPVLLLRARLHAQMNNLPLALEDVDKAIQVRAGYLPALRLRAELLAGSGKMSEAIVGLEKLTEALPTNSELLMQLGTYYLADRQPRRAIEVFDKVLEAEPTNWIALRSRGDALLSIGKQARAIRDYEAALKLQPKHTSVLNNLAWVLATSPEEKLRDGAQAIKLATKAAELTDFEQAHILSTVAAAYAETGDFDQAREWSQKALDADDGAQHEQLEKELESYQANKPWRELQNIEDKPRAKEDSSEQQAKQPRPANTADF